MSFETRHGDRLGDPRDEPASGGEAAFEPAWTCRGAPRAGDDPRADALLGELESLPFEALLARAAALRAEGHGRAIGWSRKVFVPLTRLCRDTCAYCTFATSPSAVQEAYLPPERVLAIARAGRDAGCREALFTLGDKPELRYEAARRALDRLGFSTTLDYLVAMCRLVLEETGLFPHVNAGVMDEGDIARLRAVSVSQGLMLESSSDRLCARGGPHFGSPDKEPRARLDTIAAAGRLRVPFTSGILIGIGETRRERIESLLALRDLNETYGHIQEIIVQNFRAKPGTRMAGAVEPGFDELMWTAAAARIVFGSAMNIQVPPNLSYARYPDLLAAGIDDWGGVSPVTIDHVNPEAPWPGLTPLREATAAADLDLVERLAIHPRFVRDAERWLDPALVAPVTRASDSLGFARTDDWSPGLPRPCDVAPRRAPRRATLDALLGRVSAGARLSENEIAALFAAREGDVEAIRLAADELRRRAIGDTVTYAVVRNISYTNICTYKCGFCAFSKGRGHENLRGPAYDLPLEEVARRAREAWDRGATEVCMQGGIHPRYTGETYLALLRAVLDEVPGMHVHAFSPLEVSQGAATLGLTIEAYLERLREAGLGSLPGTAAEILDDEVRAVICPDKLSTREWLDVVATAHRVGLRTTATMMFGHVDRPVHWARHLLRLRDLQETTGGFTEFVPLPFVHMEAPLYRHGLARKGPTWREVTLVHALARLVLHPVIPNIQTSWVKLGRAGAVEMLGAGVNDLGGTLMNEYISHSAGTTHGQEFGPRDMDATIREAGRVPLQRTTLYRPAPEERRRASAAAPPLGEAVAIGDVAPRRAARA